MTERSKSYKYPVYKVGPGRVLDSKGIYKVTQTLMINDYEPGQTGRDGLKNHFMSIDFMYSNQRIKMAGLNLFLCYCQE